MPTRSDSAGKVYIDVSADYTQYTNDLKELRNEAKKSSVAISNALENSLSPKQASSAIVGLSKNLRTLASSAKIPADAFDDTARRITGQLTDIARKTGTTEEKFVELNRRLLQNQAARQAENSLRNIARAADLSSKEVAELARDFGFAGKAADDMARKISRTNSNFTSLKNSFSSISLAITGLVASFGFFGADVIRTADNFNLLKSRISLVIDDTDELSSVLSELFSISQRTRQSFEATADLYTRIARSTKSLNIPQKELLAITENINKALIISGGSAQSAQAALVQLGQAFASGTLRGEELNSVLEQAPRLAQAISESVGVTIGGLRLLAAEGKITSAVVADALKSGSVSAKNISEEFDKMGITVSQSSIQISNAFSRLIGDFDESTGLTKNLAIAMTGLSENLDDVISGIKIIVAASLPLLLAGVAKGIVAVTGYIGALSVSIAGLLGPIGLATGALAALTTGLAIFLEKAENLTPIQRLEKELEKYENQLKNLQDIGDFRYTTLYTTDDTEIEDTKAKIREIKKELESLTETAKEGQKTRVLDTVKLLSVAEIKAKEDALKAIKKLEEAQQKESIKAAKNSEEAQQKELDDLYKKSVKEREKLEKKRLKDIADAEKELISNTESLTNSALTRLFTGQSNLLKSIFTDLASFVRQIFIDELSQEINRAFVAPAAKGISGFLGNFVDSFFGSLSPATAKIASTGSDLSDIAREIESIRGGETGLTRNLSNLFSPSRNINNLPALSAMTPADKISAPKFTVNVNNTISDRADSQVMTPYNDGEKWVLDVVISGVQNNRNGFRRQLQSSMQG